MNIREEFFDECIRGKIFTLDGMLFGVYSHGENGLISQHLGKTDGVTTTYILN